MADSQEQNGTPRTSRRKRPGKGPSNAQDGRKERQPARDTAAANGHPVAPPLDEEQPAEEPLATITADQLEERDIDVIWEGRIARGTVVILQGRKGVGKTTLAAAIAADFTGGPRLGRGKRRVLGPVLWFTVEENPAVMTRPKLEAAGAELARVHFPNCGPDGRVTKRLLLPVDLRHLRGTIRRTGAKLVVLDPFGSFCIPEEGHNGQLATRQLMEELALLADQTGAVFLLIRHCRKGAGGSAQDQGYGSGEIGNVARTTLLAGRGQDPRGAYVLAVVDFNLGPKGATLVYDVVSAGGAPKVKWRGECDQEADEVAEAQGDAGQRDARGDARRLLRKRIGDGWVAATELQKEANEAGIGDRTLRSAKAELHVPSRRTARGTRPLWEWGPPPGGWPPVG
jgi:hypothetical protein